MADPPHRQRWLAVRECGDQQALVAIDSSGQITVLDDRFDFYSAAALSPDGKALAWVSWQLPDMPWDRSMLCLVRLGANGDVRDALVAEPPGGGSVQQPPSSMIASSGFSRITLLVAAVSGGSKSPLAALDRRN